VSLKHIEYVVYFKIYFS